jgi:hypothetical protein
MNAPELTEQPPDPAAAEIPPPLNPNVDQLDAHENARRTATDNSVTDLLLLSIYIIGSLITLAAVLLIWRHFPHIPL